MSENEKNDNEKTIQAWTDPAFRDSLSDEERSALPSNPAGDLELEDFDLSAISGGYTWKPGNLGTCAMGTGGCCPATL